MNFIRPWLAIGKYRDTIMCDHLRTHGIESMLLLAEDVQHDGIISMYLPVEDGEPLPPELLASGVRFVKDQHAAGETVLVACGAGISRSAAYVIAVLKEVEGLSLAEAYHDLSDRHPQALPHPAIWSSLCDYYADEPTFDEFWPLLVR